MGRTSRKRTRRKKLNQSEDFEQDNCIKNLKIWLSKNKWTNETKLKLRNFPETGRGLTSKKSFKISDVLITIPYNLMITYTTIQEHILQNQAPLKEKLTVHEMLSLFLVVERNKKEKSLWSNYINSLPLEPPFLPWHAMPEEINLFPPDLQVICRKYKENFIKSFEKVKKSIKEHTDGVMNENMFKWAYTMVNTRAVFVDPKLVCRFDNDFTSEDLLDEPLMALCPFLDMFNHHFSANSEAELKYHNGKLIYQLRTLTKYKKYDQIFIAYGAFDNVKLVMEYGFFLPGNNFDVVMFHHQEILNILKICLDDRQYRFIKEHDFHLKCYIGSEGSSFNLKAFLYVSLYDQCRNFQSVIFGNCYPEEFFKKLSHLAKLLLNYKLEIFEAEYITLKNYKKQKSGSARLVESFLKYRQISLDDLKSKVVII